MSQYEPVGNNHDDKSVAEKQCHPVSYGTKVGLLTGLIILLIPMVIYIYCLCPTVFVGDAGDFLTAAYTLGVPHPPGYPLYTILGHIFMNLPIPGGLSTPAYRMNFMSAVFAWTALLFLFLYLRRVLKTEWASLVGTLALAFSSQFWQHAEITEVYSLQACFITLIFYLAVLYVQENNVSIALLLAFIMGLALSHHYAILIFYPGVLIFLGINGRLKLRWHIWLLAIYLALMGLTPYVYLPLVKYKTPLGAVTFVTSDEEAEALPKDVVAARETPLQYFLYYVGRKFYSMGRVYTHSPEALPERTTTPMVFKRFVEVTVEDFKYPLLLFGGIGWLVLLYSLKKRRRTETLKEPPLIKAPFLMPALGYIIYFLVVHFYPSGDILAAPLENLAVVVPPLLIPLQVSLAPIIALGFDASARWIAAYVQMQGVSDVASHPKYRTFITLLIIIAFSLIAVNLKDNAEYGDKSQSVISYYYALNVLDSCDPGSILLTTGDETFLFWYVQACEPSSDPADKLPGYRKDVWATNWIHNLTSLSMLSNEPEAMKTVFENFIINSGYYYPELSNYFGERPINSTFVAATFAESEIITSQDIILNGLTYLFRKPSSSPGSLTGLIKRPEIGKNISGAAPLMIIDYFDPSPFESYRWDGLPRFEGVGEDLSQLDTSIYHRVPLEPQEMEVLGRYQDALYRFGIQYLLERNEESAKKAVFYFFRCVSLDPAGWFGWKELGDSFINIGRIDSAGGAYEEVIKLSALKKDVPVDAEAGARAGLAHVELIKGNLAAAEEQARTALLMDPTSNLARAVLQEIKKIREKENLEKEGPIQVEPLPPSELNKSASEDDLRNFDTGYD